MNASWNTKACNKRLKDLDTAIENKESDVNKAKRNLTTQEKQGEFATESAKLQGLKEERRAVEVKRDLYAHPTSEESLAAADTRLAKSREFYQGEAQNRYQMAQAEYSQTQGSHQLVGGLVQALGSVTSGSGQMAHSILEAQAGYQRAFEQESNAEAQRKSSKEQEDADFQRSANEMIQHALSTMKEFLQGQVQAESAIIRNM